jgi:hypothetical protein
MKQFSLNSFNFSTIENGALPSSGCFPSVPTCPVRDAERHSKHRLYCRHETAKWGTHTRRIPEKAGKTEGCVRCTLGTRCAYIRIILARLRGCGDRKHISWTDVSRTGIALYMFIQILIVLSRSALCTCKRCSPWGVLCVWMTSPE